MFCQVLWVRFSLGQVFSGSGFLGVRFSGGQVFWGSGFLGDCRRFRSGAGSVKMIDCIDVVGLIQARKGETC